MPFPTRRITPQPRVKPVAPQSIRSRFTNSGAIPLQVTQGAKRKLQPQLKPKIISPSVVVVPRLTQGVKRKLQLQVPPRIFVSPFTNSGVIPRFTSGIKRKLQPQLKPKVVSPFVAIAPQITRGIKRKSQLQLSPRIFAPLFTNSGIVPLTTLGIKRKLQSQLPPRIVQPLSTVGIKPFIFRGAVRIPIIPIKPKTIRPSPLVIISSVPPTITKGFRQLPVARPRPFVITPPATLPVLPSTKWPDILLPDEAPTFELLAIFYSYRDNTGPLTLSSSPFVRVFSTNASSGAETNALGLTPMSQVGASGWWTSTWLPQADGVYTVEVRAPFGGQLIEATESITIRNRYDFLAPDVGYPDRMG